MTGWRDHLRIHPAAELFPLMDEAELRALADDIKKHGIHEHIAIQWSDERQCEELLDGRNRLDALELLGIDPLKHFRPSKKAPDHARRGLDLECQVDGRFCIIATTWAKVADPTAYIVSLNIVRRHLTLDQKRDIVAKMLKLEPEKSDRQIAAAAKVDGHTVASIRAKAEARAEIPHVEKRRDTRGREQPAKKAAPSVSAAVHEDMPPPPAAPRNGHAEPAAKVNGNGHAEPAAKVNGTFRQATANHIDVTPAAPEPELSVEDIIQQAMKRASAAVYLGEQARNLIQKMPEDMGGRVLDQERLGSLWTALLAAENMWKKAHSDFTDRYPFWEH